MCVHVCCQKHCVLQWILWFWIGTSKKPKGNKLVSIMSTEKSGCGRVAVIVNYRNNLMPITTCSIDLIENHWFSSGFLYFLALLAWWLRPRTVCYRILWFSFRFSLLSCLAWCLRLRTVCYRIPWFSLGFLYLPALPGGCVPAPFAIGSGGFP